MNYWSSMKSSIPSNNRKEASFQYDQTRLKRFKMKKLIEYSSPKPNSFIKRKSIEFPGKFKVMLNEKGIKIETKSKRKSRPFSTRPIQIKRPTYDDRKEDSWKVGSSYKLGTSFHNHSQIIKSELYKSNACDLEEFSIPRSALIKSEHVSPAREDSCRADLNMKGFKMRSLLLNDFRKMSVK